MPLSWRGILTKGGKGVKRKGHLQAVFSSQGFGWREGFVDFALRADVLVIDLPDRNIGPDAVDVQDGYFDQFNAGVWVWSRELLGVDFFRGIALGRDCFLGIVAGGSVVAVVIIAPPFIGIIMILSSVAVVWVILVVMIEMPVIVIPVGPIVIVAVLFVVVSDDSAGDGADGYGHFHGDAVDVVADDHAGGGAQDGAHDGVIGICLSRMAGAEG